MCVAGVFYPRIAAAASATWGIGYLIYARGYAAQGPSALLATVHDDSIRTLQTATEGRVKGTKLIYPADIATAGMVAYIAWDILVGAAA